MTPTPEAPPAPSQVLIHDLVLSPRLVPLPAKCPGCDADTAAPGALEVWRAREQQVPASLAATTDDGDLAGGLCLDLGEAVSVPTISAPPHQVLAVHCAYCGGELATGTHTIEPCPGCAGLGYVPDGWQPLPHDYARRADVVGACRFCGTSPSRHPLHVHGPCSERTRLAWAARAPRGVVHACRWCVTLPGDPEAASSDLSQLRAVAQLAAKRGVVSAAELAAAVEAGTPDALQPLAAKVYGPALAITRPRLPQVADRLRALANRWRGDADEIARDDTSGRGELGYGEGKAYCAGALDALLTELQAEAGSAMIAYHLGDQAAGVTVAAPPPPATPLRGGTPATHHPAPPLPLDASGAAGPSLATDNGKV